VVLRCCHFALEQLDEDSTMEQLRVIAKGRSYEAWQLRNSRCNRVLMKLRRHSDSQRNVRRTD
jgi:hypothetical protein